MVLMLKSVSVKDDPTDRKVFKKVLDEISLKRYTYGSGVDRGS
jgi:hypothetical protein